LLPAKVVHSIFSGLFDHLAFPQTRHCFVVPENQKGPNLKDIIEEFQSKEPKQSDRGKR
jgi:hypothetical protein